MKEALTEEEEEEEEALEVGVVVEAPTIAVGMQRVTAAIITVTTMEVGVGGEKVGVVVEAATTPSSMNSPSTQGGPKRLPRKRCSLQHPHHLATQPSRPLPHLLLGGL